MQLYRQPGATLRRTALPTKSAQQGQTQDPALCGVLLAQSAAMKFICDLIHDGRITCQAAAAKCLQVG